jgi:hypothetical protein
MFDEAANSQGCGSSRDDAEQNTDPIPIRLNQLKRRLPPLCNESPQRKRGFRRQLGVSVLALWQTLFSLERTIEAYRPSA